MAVLIALTFYYWRLYVRRACVVFAYPDSSLDEMHRSQASALAQGSENVGHGSPGQAAMNTDRCRSIDRAFTCPSSDRKERA